MRESYGNGRSSGSNTCGLSSAVVLSWVRLRYSNLFYYFNADSRFPASGGRWRLDNKVVHLLKASTTKAESVGAFKILTKW